MSTANRILVVEDDEDIRETIEAVLTSEGYSVDLATNGREALAILREPPPPALVLLDLMMPVMDGWEFRAEQAKDPALYRVPVVVLSGISELRKTVDALGVAGAIQKPFGASDLLAVVERVVGRAPPRERPT